MAANSEQPGSESADDFVAGIEQKLVGGMMGLGIAVGMQTGLFEVMIALKAEPKSCQEIADAGNYKERYVREWLGCMTSARIVNFDPNGEKYWLPAHRFNILDLKGLAMSAPILCGGFLQVVECFKKDGPTGVPYQQYPQFDELMTLTQGPFFKDKLVQDFIPSMPQVQKLLNDGIVVLDAGCGAGLSTRLMARHFPKSHFYGLDLSETAIAEAQCQVAKMGLANAEFVCADVTRMPSEWSDKFDFLCFIFVLHDLSDPAKALGEAYRVLKAGSPLAIIEVNSHSKLQDNLQLFEDQDRVMVDFTYSLLNCLPTSLSQGGGAGLGAFWGREEAQKMIEKANLEVLSITELATESMHIMCQKP